MEREGERERRGGREREILPVLDNDLILDLQKKKSYTSKFVKIERLFDRYPALLTIRNVRYKDRCTGFLAQKVQNSMIAKSHEVKLGQIFYT